MSSRISVRQIEAFRAVMINGGMTAASRQLNITQPAISRLIMDLEENLRLKLFRREGSQLTPTDDASRLLKEVERVFFGLDSIVEAARTIRRFPRSKLSIAAMPLLSIGYLANAIRKVCSEHEHLGVAVHSDISHSIVGQMARGEHDIGICSIPPGMEAHFRIHSEIKAQAVCILPASHHLATKPTLSVADIGSEPLIALGRSSFLRRRVSALFELAGITPNIVVETLYSATAVSFVEEGLGLSIIDPFVARFRTPENVVVRDFEPSVPYGFFIVTAKHAQPDGNIDSFVSALKESIKEYVPNVRIGACASLAGHARLSCRDTPERSGA